MKVFILLFLSVSVPSVFAAPAPVLRGEAYERAVIATVEAQTQMKCTAREVIRHCEHTPTGPNGMPGGYTYCYGYRGTECSVPGAEKASLILDTSYNIVNGREYKLGRIDFVTTRAARRSGQTIAGLDTSFEARLESALQAQELSCRGLDATRVNCIPRFFAGNGCRQERTSACYATNAPSNARATLKVQYEYRGPSTFRGRQDGDLAIDGVAFQF